MADLKLLKEPGYVCDLMLLFFLHFNEQCTENFINKNKEKEDREHFEGILKSFYPISEDLYVFFHALENKNCFMTLNYFYRYKEEFALDYSADTLQKALSDYPDVTKRLLQFYFHKLNSEQIDYYIGNDRELFRLIKDSGYSEQEKNRLYEFFMEPVTYIQKLQYELLEKEVKLSSYYEKQYKKILEVYSNVSYETLESELANIKKDISYVRTEEQPLYLSFCLFNKNCLNFIPTEDGLVYILGIDYSSIIFYLKKRKVEVRLADFGLVMSDENRLKILNLIYEKGEVNRRTLEMECGLSSSVIYHNLTMMTRCGMLKTRNQGKAIYYSVNNSYIEKIISEINKYSKKVEDKK